MFHQTTHVSPILCLSSAIGEFSNDPELQRDEFYFPVDFTSAKFAMTEFPTTLFTTHLNSTQRQLISKLQRKILRLQSDNPSLLLDDVDLENRMRLGGRYSPLTFHIVANDNDSKECNNNEIIGLSTEEEVSIHDVRELSKVHLHYFDVKHVEKDHMFDESWTCPANHYVHKIVLYRRENCLIAFQLFSKPFPNDEPLFSFQEMVPNNLEMEEPNEMFQLIGFILLLLFFLVCLGIYLCSI